MTSNNQNLQLRQRRRSKTATAFTRHDGKWITARAGCSQDLRPDVSLRAQGWGDTRVNLAVHVGGVSDLNNCVPDTETHPVLYMLRRNDVDPVPLGINEVRIPPDTAGTSHDFAMCHHCQHTLHQSHTYGKTYSPTPTHTRANTKYMSPNRAEIAHAVRLQRLRKEA